MCTYWQLLLLPCTETHLCVLFVICKHSDWKTVVNSHWTTHVRVPSLRWLEQRTLLLGTQCWIFLANKRHLDSVGHCCKQQQHGSSGLFQQLHSRFVFRSTGLLVSDVCHLLRNFRAEEVLPGFEEASRVVLLCLWFEHVKSYNHISFLSDVNKSRFFLLSVNMRGKGKVGMEDFELLKVLGTGGKESSYSLFSNKKKIDAIQHQNIYFNFLVVLCKKLP